MPRKTKSLRETKPAYRTRRAPSVRRKPPVAKRVPQAQPHKEVVIHKIGVEGKPITYRVPNPEWLPIIKRDDALYEKYARHLEVKHKGEFVAIGLNGEVIVREEMADAGLAAIERFGRGKFALRRIAYDAEIINR